MGSPHSAESGASIEQYSSDMGSEDFQAIAQLRAEHQAIAQLRVEAIAHLRSCEQDVQTRWGSPRAAWSARSAQNLGAEAIAHLRAEQVVQRRRGSPPACASSGPRQRGDSDEAIKAGGSARLQILPAPVPAVASRVNGME